MGLLWVVEGDGGMEKGRVVGVGEERGGDGRGIDE